MDEVVIIYGTQVETMVRQLIEETGSMGQLRSDDSVMIKPNLVASRKDWIGIDTDPRVIEALVKCLKDRDVHRITVGDGSGMGNSATKAFEYCGYRDLSNRYGLRLVDLEKDEFIKKPVSIEGPFKNLEIARTVLECDFFINVPVMKAHNETLITCSLKNLKGIMSRSMKTAFHSVDLHRAVAQLNSILVPDLIVVDGLQGDLHSETGHDPVAMDRIILGTNPVEVDSVVADALGYAPRNIRHIGYSSDAGLGTCDLKEIRIRSLNRPSGKKRFSPPIHYSKRFPCHISAEGACCTCMGNFIFAMERLKEQGLLSERFSFLIGQNPKIPTDKKTLAIAVGQCASKQYGVDLRIDECPPSTGKILQCVASIVDR
ncbi:MAG: hypothetical protein A2157_00025 [Deltaproteobacteria bacterium RBG_16_47_11]|nr:MAG: hypothetical protein A2157_00025 [Deltaproteobacteria bacterium RBG_16_47_11]